MIWTDDWIESIVNSIIGSTSERRYLQKRIQEMRDEYEARLESIKQEGADYHAMLIIEYQNSKAKDVRIAELEKQIDGCQNTISDQWLTINEKQNRIEQLEVNCQISSL